MKLLWATSAPTSLANRKHQDAPAHEWFWLEGLCTGILPGIFRTSKGKVSETVNQLCLQSAGDVF